MLNDIFSDRSFRYTAPVDQNSAPAPPIYLNFDQLYLEAVLSSMKTTQNLRTKLIENPQFAINFCKVRRLVKARSCAVGLVADTVHTSRCRF